jgi:elongator complex protein 3
MNISTQIIKYLQKNPPKSEKDILFAKRKFCKETKTHRAPSNSMLLAEYRRLKMSSPNLHNLLKKRGVRTLSGVAPIAVLTKPYPCPGNCAYCPNENEMPKSYLSNEPAVMRAILCKFNPYKQVQMRLQALNSNGHETDKLELIVMGGTWSYLPTSYQNRYITECFRAANDFPRSIKKTKTTLEREQKRNETAKSRIIGLTLETRPDYIDKKELEKMRNFGCTRIEIGVQHIDDKVLKLNKRGHNNDATIRATALMRDFGFKITYHMMLNLAGSTPAKDLSMMKTIFTSPNYQPDQIKIYPTIVSKGSLLYNWHHQGKWKSYTTKQLVNLLIKIKSITPPWVRIIRVIRDIPEESIIAGNKITNMRQIIQSEMKDKGVSCNCIRCREAGHALKNGNIVTAQKYFKRQYKVQNGKECFLSFESPNKKILYAFCRLFLPNDSDTAIVRELHTYGQMASIGKIGNIQHTGLGKKLLASAEKLSRKSAYSKLSIISGIGVRNYYKKFNYKLDNTYMIKGI